MVGGDGAEVPAADRAARDASCVVICWPKLHKGNKKSNRSISNNFFMTAGELSNSYCNNHNRVHLGRNAF